MKALLEGDVAVVTGAAQGNGRAIAMGLARHGAHVVAADINAAGAEAVAAAIRTEGGTAVALGVDVANREQCQRLAAEVEARLGPASILVNNAGILRRVPVSDLGDSAFAEAWDAMFAVNVDGAMNMVQAFLPQLRRCRGRIVNLGSIMSFVSAPRIVAYSATKGAVRQMTKGLAAELAADGIRVNAIAPGVIATPMTTETRADPQTLARFLAHTPLGRVGEPEELVGPVVFLVSELSSYVTGVTLPVDGGYLAL